MNRPEAEQIAAAVAMIRPDWLQTSLIKMLEKHQQRPARDVMLALVWCAYDPATDSPGRINQPGPWWDVARLAGAESSRHWSFAWAAASEMAHDGWPTESTEARSLVVDCIRASVGGAA